MPCSACGFAVDVLRSCYVSTWNLPGVGLVDGKYSFCGEDVPFYPVPNLLGSRNWHWNDGTDWPEFGETETARQRWRNGSVPVRVPALVVIDDQSPFLSTMRGINAGPYAGQIAGYDRRCWRNGEPYVDDAGAIRVKYGLTASSSIQLAAGGSMPATASLTADSLVELLAAGALPAAIGLTGESVAEYIAGGSMPATASLTADSLVELLAGGALPAAIGLTGESVAEYIAGGSMPATASLTADSLVELLAGGALPAAASLTGTSFKTNLATSGNVKAKASLTASSRKTP